jgi:hypothetical protein
MARPSTTNAIFDAARIVGIGEGKSDMFLGRASP